MVASLLVARGFVVSAPPSISESEERHVVETQDCPPSTKLDVKEEGRVCEGTEKRSRQTSCLDMLFEGKHIIIFSDWLVHRCTDLIAGTLMVSTRKKMAMVSTPEPEKLVEEFPQRKKRAASDTTPGKSRIKRAASSDGNTLSVSQSQG